MPAPALARDPALRITNQAVYEWLQGHAPHPARAIALVRLSGGRLTLESIYGHCLQMQGLPEPLIGDPLEPADCGQQP